MHYRMSQSKTGWLCLYVVIFSLWCASSWTNQGVTTPEIIDQIQELILEVRRISAKSIAEQLDISREEVGSIIHEDLDMRKLSAKWVPKYLNAEH